MFSQGVCLCLLSFCSLFVSVCLFLTRSDMRKMQETKSTDNIQFLPFLTTCLKWVCVCACMHNHICCTSLCITSNKPLFFFFAPQQPWMVVLWGSEEWSDHHPGQHYRGPPSDSVHRHVFTLHKSEGQQVLPSACACVHVWVSFSVT